MSKEIEKNLSLACPACQDFRSKDFGRKNNLDIFICRNCSSVYTPRAENLIADYDNSYEEHSVHAEVPEFVNSRLDEYVSTFESFRQNGRFLDIGCGAGSFLQAARRAGWEVQGTEVSKSAVEILRADEMNVFQGILQEAEYPSNHFDVVVASYVLEHVPEPLEVIKEVHRVLRPGGLFWLSVPQGRGISSRILGAKWSQVEPPVHWCLLSGKGMKTLLENAGFSKIQMSLGGVDPFEILQTLRKKNTKEKVAESTDQNDEKFKDVESRRGVYEKLLSNPLTRVAKDTINYGLNLTKMGDFLKARAVK